MQATTRWTPALAILVLFALCTGVVSSKTIFDDDWTPPTAASKPVEIPPLTPPPSAVPPRPAGGPATGLTEAPKTLTHSTSASPGRLPVPPLAQLTKSRKIFKEVFARKLAETGAAAQRALAQRLLDEAEKASSVPADFFVLLAGARLKIPYFPPAEYDFHIRFTRIYGFDYVAQIMCHDGHGFAWINGDKGGVNDGFSWISGKGPSANATTVLASPAERVAGATHDSVVQVRKNYVAAYMDGHLTARYQTDFSEFTLPATISLGEDGIGLRTWKTGTAFSVVELVEVTGTGHVLPHGK